MDLHTGTPFWPARNGTMPSYPHLDQDARADVAVIGSGITGALAAYELTRAGADVIVIESHDAVGGSSAATSGLLLYETDTSLEDLAAVVGMDGAARVYTLGLRAIDRIEEVCRSLPSSCGFARRPSIYLASNEKSVANMRREFELRRAHGFDCDWMTAHDITSRYSFTGAAAIATRGTAEIDCHQFAHRLLEAAANAGARICCQSPVVTMSPDQTGVTLVTAGGATVRARHAVAASGYEASEHLARHTGDLQSTWVLVTEPLLDFSGWRDRCLIWETARPYIYVRSTDDGRLLIGGEDEPSAEAHRDPAHFDAKMNALTRRAEAMFPRIPIRPAYCWAGTFATTVDGLPYIGEIPECPNVWYTLGYGGNGITFSAIAAVLIRDTYLGRDNPDAKLFGFTRQQSLPQRAAGIE
jgi:glycine/D-amino acid oxidase-like deaminating enzyme